MRLRRTRPVALALAAGLLTMPLAACGGGDVEGESGSDGDQTPTAPPTGDDGDGDSQTGEQDDP